MTIDSCTATYIILGFILMFGILLPILDKLPKVKDFVSLRWTIVVIYSALCIGVLIDFQHLDNDVRYIVVIGGVILAGIFLVFRSVEKFFVNKWNVPVSHARISKGDVSAEFSVLPQNALDTDKNNTESVPSQASMISKIIEDTKECSSDNDSLDQALLDTQPRFNNTKPNKNKSLFRL